MTRSEKYLKNIGNKFDADGLVRFFPGNTVISFIDHNAPIFTFFTEVRQMLRNTCAGDCFTYMPDSSIHMTVFEGVCDQWRTNASWTNLLSLDAPLTEVDRLFEKRFADVPKLGKVQMRTSGIKTGAGYSIALVPNTEEDAARLRSYREHVSDALGIRFPDFETYGFHISMGYGTKAPTPEQDAALDAFEQEAGELIARKALVFDVVEPNLTFFRDMFAFEKERFDR